MTLLTYYSLVPDINAEDELRMLAHWRRHHEAIGFKTFVLQEFHARKHPYFEEFYSKVSQLPSINPKGYDVACYLRWLAAAASPLPSPIMMDYDTYLFPSVADDLGPLTCPDCGDDLRLKVYQGYVPSIVRGLPKHYFEWCKRFAAYKPAPDLKHTSDMIILEETLKAEPDAFIPINYVKHYTDQFWETAPAVHFCNAVMTPNGKTPRWKHIPELRKLQYQP